MQAHVRKHTNDIQCNYHAAICIKKAMDKASS
ncbi:Uncharacterised protein [Vibrio cholerae]|nr:Uncharacterised protein [Vibrio cholerae]